MLERARTCLKSGAQDPLRCLQTAPRSKHMLHSSFFRHGAGDLGLPPWAMMFPTPIDLPLRHDSTPLRVRLKDGEVPMIWSIPTDGLLFDFLYPPQALAWLQRSQGQHWERWERRNARRLPEGFIQASRGYASRSYAQAAFAREEKPTMEQQEETQNLKRPWTDEGREAEKISEVKGLATQQGNARDEGLHPECNTQAPKIEDNHNLAQGAFADSPGDLAEVESDTHLMLRTMLASTRERLVLMRPEQAQKQTERVWRLYQGLDEETKEDVKLKIELLDWLSALPAQTAGQRAAEIYDSIATDQRTSFVYQAALSAFLRQRNHRQALKLHKEAIGSIENAGPITKQFFLYAVEHRRWQLAMLIEARHRRVYSKPEQSGQQAMFWIHVSETPRLLRSALALANYTRALDRAKRSNAQTHRFCALFFKEALVQELKPRRPSDGDLSTARGLSLVWIEDLFRYIGYLGEETPRFLEDVLIALLRPDARYEYSKVHRIVSGIYLQLRRSGGHQVPEELLMTLLERLTRHYDKYQTPRARSNSFSISMLVSDWRRSHDRLSVKAVELLMSFCARNGIVKRLEHWAAYLRSTYPDYAEQKTALWTTIYLHARRADLTKAKEAFDDVDALATKNGSIPELQCWNVLLHAHARADDVEGALNTLQKLLDQGLTPDEYSFHPVLELLARRGDVEGVRHMLDQYDALAKKKREAAFFGSLLQAHVNCGEVDEAETVLRSALDEVRSGQVRGSLTGSFNIVLTAHACRRNIDATMRTYRWMRAQGIRMNADTYAALILALVHYRQTDAAYQILRKVMKQQNLQPTAFHHALIMLGYVKSNQPKAALRVHARMKLANVRSTFSTETVYFKARALLERYQFKRQHGPNEGHMPLSKTITELGKILSHVDGNDIAPKQPQLGIGISGLASANPVVYFDFLIQIHGTQRCFDAVRNLYQQYNSTVSERSGSTNPDPPLRLLTGLMSANLQASEYGEVERWWELAKRQADEIAPLVRVPRLRPAQAANEEQSGSDILQLQPAYSLDGKEAGEGFHNRARPPTNNESITDQRQMLLSSKDVSPIPQRPSPGRAHVLSRPLRFYLYALAAQDRIPDMLTLVPRLVAQGYTLDNRTWNVFIQLLCNASPPLTLLAFTLTERFLMPLWPGWAPVSPQYIPNPSAKAEGLQYIRTRYLRPGQLMPHYRTMVTLGAAYLELRKIEAMGRRGVLGRQNMKGMERYVGSTRHIRQHAPRTLFAVQSMPSINDRLQRELLRRE